MLADSGVLGENLLVWLVLALGAAMIVGYGMALLRPPPGATSKGKGSAGKGGGGSGRPGKGSGRPAQRSGRAAGARARSGRGNDLPQAPLGRSALMIGIGVLAVIWSAATLIKG